MNITQENVDELNAVVKVNVSPADYDEKVKSVLNDYRRKAKIPGFRPGKVPFGMVKKMYGKSVLAEELNKVVYDNLHKYLSENKIEILGNPLPKDEDLSLNLEEQTDFEFIYDIGLAPKFEVKISDKDKFTKYQIAANDELIDKQINELARRYGKVSETDKVSLNDMAQGEFVELDKDNNIVEGGIMHTSTIALEFIKDDKSKEQLVDKKVGDVITIDPYKVSKGEADTAAMLGITTEELANVDTNFNFKITKIFHIEGADINQELFDKLFGPNEVKDETEFRLRIQTDIEKMLDGESEKKLKIDISEKLIDKLKLSLPDDFLKKWLIKANEEKLTLEDIAKEYDQYAKGLKWQLIENKIIQENDIKVEPEEAIERAKGLITQQYAQYGGLDMLEEDQLTEMASNLLKDKEQGKKVYEMLFDEKLTALFKSSFKLKEKEVTFDEFVKLATEKQSKFKLLDSLKNLTNKR